MRYCSIGGLMLVHRLRRWPNIKPPMVEGILFVDWVRDKLYGVERY